MHTDVDPAGAVDAMYGIAVTALQVGHAIGKRTATESAGNIGNSTLLRRPHESIRGTTEDYAVWAVACRSDSRNRPRARIR